VTTNPKESASFYAHPIFSSVITVAISTALWVGLACSLAYFEHSALLSVAAFAFVVAPLLLFSALNVAHSLHRLVWAALVHRASLPRHGLVAIRAFPKLARARYDVLRLCNQTLIAAVVLVLHWWLNVAMPLAVEAHALSAMLVISLRVCLPPAFLYLASSAPDRLLLAQTLQMRSIPGVTCLLDVSNHIEVQGSRIGSFSKLFVVLFDARTKRDRDWQALVDSLVRVVPVIILDTRDTTEGVLHEVRRIDELRLLHKSIFVSNEHGECPALAALGLEIPSLPDRQIVGKPDAIVRWVQAVTFRPSSCRSKYNAADLNPSFKRTRQQRSAQVKR
jgi:hypothetical protein